MTTLRKTPFFVRIALSLLSLKLRGIRIGFFICFGWGGGEKERLRATVIFAQLLPSINIEVFLIVVIWSP